MTEDLDLQGKKKKEGEDPEPDKNLKPGADPKNTDPKDPPGPVPYLRFKEVNDKAKAYETRLAELEAKNLERESENDKARQARLKEQEKFQELAEEWQGKYETMEPEFSAQKAELEINNALLEAYANSELELVPELYRDVVSKLPLAERLAWFTDNKDKLGETKPKGIPVTPKGSGSGEISDEERRKLSARTF